MRDGDAVAWRGWRGHTCTTEPPGMRFDAALYDAGIARTEAGHSWEWRARTVARHLETVDPKSGATIVGGRREDAGELGHPWPEPDA